MSFDRLLIELITIVVDNLVEERETLKSLSLLSRIFIPSCRTHLFKTLRLNTLNPLLEYKCASWAKLLEQSTEILTYIRVLELGPPISQLMDRDPSMHSKHWEQVESTGLPSINDERVQQIAEGAINVQSLTLRFEFQSWNNFSSSFKQTIQHLLRRKSVSILNLEDVVDFPIEELRFCKQLRDLSLACVDLADGIDVAQQDFDDAPVPTDSEDHLDTITIFMSDNCVERFIRALSHPSSHLRLSSLRRLSVNVTNSDCRAALHRLPSLAHTITTLELRTDGVNGYDLCNLDDFPELRTLLVSFSYNRHQRPLNVLAQFISKSTKPSKLEELHLVFRHDVPNLQREKGSQDLMRLCVNRDWQTLEHAVINRGLFSSLRRMALVFRPKDVTTFMNNRLIISLQLFLIKGMPMLYAMTNPIIEVYDDRFEQYTKQT